MCALPNQFVCTDAVRHINCTRDGKERSALRQRIARRNQRAAVFGCFDDENAPCKTADQTVSLREIARVRLCAGRVFADGKAVAQLAPGGDVRQIGLKLLQERKI